jgi:EH_Signature domain
MIEIVEALRRIELQQQTIGRSYLAVPLDASRECKALAEVSADFARRASEPRKLKPLLDPETVWRQWAASQFDPDGLDARHMKTLCVSPETATRPELVRALQKDASALARTSCLMGLVHSYFAKWGQIRRQNELEALIAGALRAYSRRNPLILKYRENAGLLFNPAAADRLGSLSVEKRQSPKVHVASFHIGLAANLAISALSSAAQTFRSLSSPTSPADGQERLKYGLQDLLVPELPLTDFQAVVSALIESEWVEKNPNTRDALRQYVLRHKQLGDPRLQVKNWSGMGQAATAKFLQWIARESIVFFFNHILPDNSANERRKDFWLEYLGGIKDFQVALSGRDYTRLYARSRLAEVPGFGRVDHETTSAFIMRFGVRGGGDDVIIVEFSETGNAAHVFSASVFERRAGKLRNVQFNFHRLKHEANEDRILHLGAWEMYARNKLAGWGVRR